MGAAASLVSALFVSALQAAPRAQIPFAQTVSDLSSTDTSVRLKAVQLLKDAAFPEAALPLAQVIADPRDDIQLEAIAGELNIFLAERIVTRKRVGLVVEVRTPIAAEAAFAAGPAALGAEVVPPDVLTALRSAARDENPRVALEALYAFGVLSGSPGGAGRRELLGTAGPDIAALVGATDPAVRLAAVRVMGRLFVPRAHDEPIEATVGDAVITALNDSDRAVKMAAMASLGAMRYERGVMALADLFRYYVSGDLAKAALDALARIGSAVSVPVFVEQLAGRSSALRAIAIEGLARVGEPERIADVQRAAAADRSDGVVLAAAFASALLANGSIDRIVEALTRPKLHDRAHTYLVEAAPGRGEAFRRHALDPDPRIRLDVVGILEAAGDPSALPVVEPLAQDKDPQVAGAATRAAARLRAAINRPAS